jgi:hypothetical protein
MKLNVKEALQVRGGGATDACTCGVHMCIFSEARGCGVWQLGTSLPPSDVFGGARQPLVTLQSCKPCCVHRVHVLRHRVKDKATHCVCVVLQEYGVTGDVVSYGANADWASGLHSLTPKQQQQVGRAMRAGLLVCRGSALNQLSLWRAYGNNHRRPARRAACCRDMCCCLLLARQETTPRVSTAILRPVPGSGFGA